MSLEEGLRIDLFLMEVKVASAALIAQAALPSKEFKRLAGAYLFFFFFWTERLFPPRACVRAMATACF